MNEWTWPTADEKGLAGFVNEEAAKLLGKLSVNSFDLLQDEDGRRELVETIYESLRSKDIRYAYEPYQPQEETQIIRPPSEILSGLSEGTCLDVALLFCGICLGHNLLPLLIIIDGHALAAVSLIHKRDEWNSYDSRRRLFNPDNRELFKGEENLKKLKELVNNGDYIAVECTGFAHTDSFSNLQVPEANGRKNGFLSFHQAVKAGYKQLNYSDRPFKFAIDIAVAQENWRIPIKKIPNLATELRQVQVQQDVKKSKNDEITGAKATGEATRGKFGIYQSVGESESSKITGWKGSDGKAELERRDGTKKSSA